MILAEGVPPLRPRPRPGAALSAPVIAADTGAPDARPAPRPGAAQRPAEVVQPAAALPADPALLPRPKPRPENLPRLSAAIGAGFRPQPIPEPTTGSKGAVCGNPAIRGTPIPPIRGAVPGCGLSDGVAVTAVSGVRLSTPAQIDCTTARALNTWVESAVKPAVGRLGGGLAGLEVAASYSCRGRNNQAGAKVSEHGKGHAVDISGLILANGVTVSVLKGWRDRQQGKILRSIHRSACGTFGTVLGPGSDGFHENHIHVDTARYRSGSYCR